MKKNRYSQRSVDESIYEETYIPLDAEAVNEKGMQRSVDCEHQGKNGQGGYSMSVAFIATI